MRFIFLLCATLVACDDGGPTEDPVEDARIARDAEQPDPDAGTPEPDAEPPEEDAAPEEDAGPVEDAGVEVDAERTEPGPLKDEVEPEAIEAEWLLGAVAGENDAIFGTLERRTFNTPQAGADFLLGGEWVPFEPGEEGQLEGFPGGVGYLVGEVELEAGEYMFARADRGLAVFSNFVRQPADIYGSGRLRMPLRAQAGRNQVVYRAFGARGTPGFEVWKTTDEVHFNFADVTRPDLIVGSQDAAPLGVALVIMRPQALRDVHAKVVESDDFEATDVAYPSLPGGATTQIGFDLVPKRAWEEGEMVEIRLRLESPSLNWSYERSYTIETHPAGVAYRQTFWSRVDGSVQYYGVQPPIDYGRARPPRG